MRLKALIIVAILFIIWFFLPSTLFVSDRDEVFSHISPDKKFTAVVYRTKIISPYSFYKLLQNENYYFILYDKNHCIIFKPSIFYGTSNLGASDSIEYIYNEKHYLFYPGKNGYESFELNK
ncbi:DUF6201 family protein [Rosenbergiella australiborealis]|uniref:DUF6201 family protein n=1 Tax=Rosenbergiella australiborealis TaxID=1544696 RepID=UPI00387E8A7F